MPPVVSLVVRNALGNRVRALLTVLVIAVAVLAFSLLQTAVKAYYIGVEASAPDRMVTRHSVSLMFSLPLADRERIAAVDGVRDIGYGNWFGGHYRDPRRGFFAQFAVDDRYLDLYPEFVLAPEEKTAFLAERQACVLGEKLARKYGWKIGDRFTLTGTIFPGDWEFVVRGIYRGRDRTTDTTSMFFRWDYLNEWVKANYNTSDRVGWYVFRIADPSRTARIAKAVDGQFADSSAPTLTETEKAFNMSFVSMAGAIVVAIEIVSFVVVVIVLLVMANTMMMAARERTSQYAVMKTIGFRPPHLAGAILGEAVVVSLLGAAAGIAIAYPAISFFGEVLETNLGSFFPVFELGPSTILAAVALCLTCGVLSAVYPFVTAAGTPIASALRKVN